MNLAFEVFETNWRSLDPSIVALACAAHACL